MRFSSTFCIFACCTSIATVACDEVPTEVARAPGQPLPGLGEAELARFYAGKALFEHEFTPKEGLGPVFNAPMCSSCHDLPTSGGTGVEKTTVATRWIAEEGRCDLLEDEGGRVLRFRTTAYLQEVLRDQGIERRLFPPSATEIVEMAAPMLYGLGLIDAIPKMAILSQARQPVNDDGIRGRTGTTPDGRLGRFGRKADHATLLEFVANALVLELGITSQYHHDEGSLDGMPLPHSGNLIPGPELDSAAVALLTDYIRFLAPPARRLPVDSKEMDRALAGERVFHQIGCASCHVPQLTTGPSETSALHQKPVHLYSDLLLHDLGPQMASVCGHAAGPSEWRTAMLMGVGNRLRLLHDGRSSQLEEAILFHGGDAASSRKSFMELTAEKKLALQAFLRTL